MPHVEYNGWPSASQLKSLFPSPSLELWKNAVGEEKAQAILEKSQEAGSRIHGVLENWMRGEVYPEGTFENKLTNSAEEFLAESQLTVFQVEQHLTSSTQRFHGTPDLVCKDKDGKLVLVDWKTGNLIDGTAFIQLAAYAYMLPERCATGYFCKIDKKTGSLTAIKVDGLDEWDWLVEGLARTWWRKNGVKK